MAEKTVDSSAYHPTDVAGLDMRSFDAAAALGSTPGELAGALHGLQGPFTAEDIQAAVQAYRERPIPAG